MYETSRIIEIGYIITDNNLNKIHESSHIVNNDVDINNSFIHGITNKLVESDGITMRVFFTKFYNDLTRFNVIKIISHNIHFDRNILLSEIIRFHKNKIITRHNKLDYKFVKDIAFECTMMIGKRFLKMKKNPKLIVLHKILNNLDIEQQQTHRALDDVQLCYECYKLMFNI